MPDITLTDNFALSDPIHVSRERTRSGSPFDHSGNLGPRDTLHRQLDTARLLVDSISMLFNRQINDAFDDTSIVDNTSWFSSISRVGKDNSAVWDVQFRFPNIQIAQGAKIESAVIQVASGGGLPFTPLLTRFFGEDVDNAAKVADAGDWNARVGNTTTADVAWSVPSFIDQFDLHTSPDISSIIQELVDRPGWNSGQAVNIWWLDDGTSSGAFHYRVMEDSAPFWPILQIQVSQAETAVEIGRILGDNIAINTGSFSRHPFDVKEDFEHQSNHIFTNNVIQRAGQASEISNNAGFRYTNILIPQGSIINSAFIRFIPFDDQSGTTCNTKFRAQDLDDTIAPTSEAEWESMMEPVGTKQTTAFVNWSNVPAWTSAVPVDGPDISTIIQEIIDRPGWNSGNALTVTWYDNFSTNGAVRREGGNPWTEAESTELFVTFEKPSIGVTRITHDHLHVGWIESPVKIMPMNDVLQTPQYIRTRIL